MKISELGISGCYLIEPTRLTDERGCFVKMFHEGAYEEMGLNLHVKEEYYSISLRNVVRGLHFQNPPHDHDKLVYCSQGEVLDVFVDLRKGSSTYGEHQKLIINEKNMHSLFLPKGIAHGFLTLSDTATMIYKTSSVYDPASDAGILWDSCGIEWPTVEPIISDRDINFPKLCDFESPF